MTVTAPARRPSTGARRAGYVIGAAINAAFLLLINVAPGWDAVPFLTADAGRLVGLVNVSLVLGLVCNLVYVLADPVWLTSLGGLITTGVGLVVLVRFWQVFPFDFGDAAFDWAMLVRVVLVVGIVGSIIGLVVQTVSLVRAGSAHRP
jgi:hypothetical protein